MAATKILFADYQSFPKPKRVYLDSNFAIRLLFYEINLGKPHALSKEPEAGDCFKFYQQVSGDGVEMVGSVFTFSETLHYYAFHYPDGMYDRSKKYLLAHGVPAAAHQSPQKNFKHFLKFYPADCDAAWKTIRYRVEATEKFFSKYGIKLLHPLPSPQLSNITGDVVRLATLLMDFFVGIESNDAFHLAIADYLDSDAVISLDVAFCGVDSYTVYTRS
jgi:hypothetical protein